MPGKKKPAPRVAVPDQDLDASEQERLQATLRKVTGTEVYVVLPETPNTNTCTTEDGADEDFEATETIAITLRVPDASDELGLKIIVFRISAPGEGKSLLDQHFGHVKGVRDRNLNRGEDGKDKADDACETAQLIYNTGSGLRNTVASVITFDRKLTHNKDPTLPARLKKLMTVIKEIKRLPNDDLIFREHTGFGRGIILTAAQQETMWSTDANLKHAVPQLVYTIVDVPSAADKEQVQHARTIKSDKIKKEKKKKELEEKGARKKYLEKQQSIQKNTASAQTAGGLHRCCKTNAVGAQCVDVFTHAKGLENHLKKKTHRFTSAFNVTPLLAVANYATNAAGLQSAYDSFTSRPNDVASRVELLKTVKCMNAPRKYRTPTYRGNARTGMEKKKIIYKTDIQKKSLLDMYMEGVRSSGSTVTAEAAHERMKCKLTNDGLRFYSSTSGNGVLLSVNQIKQYFSTLHKAYTTGGGSGVGSSKKKKETLSKESALKSGVLKGLGAATVKFLLPTVPTFKVLAEMTNQDVCSAALLFGKNLSTSTKKVLAWRSLACEKFDILLNVEEVDNDENNVEEVDNDENNEAGDNNGGNNATNDGDLVSNGGAGGNNDSNDSSSGSGGGGGGGNSSRKEKINEWDSAITYKKGDIIYYNADGVREYYKAKDDGAGEDFEEWELLDEDEL
jgi:hypothetical protein